MAKFDGRLEFDLTLIAYRGSDKWVDGVIDDIYACLRQSRIPPAGKGCDYCAYRDAINLAVR